MLPDAETTSLIRPHDAASGYPDQYLSSLMVPEPFTIFRTVASPAILPNV